jgi:hypothetical protein
MPLGGFTHTRRASNLIQLSVYADVNIFGGSIHTTWKNVVLEIASKETCLEVNDEKTKYMVTSQ